MEYCSKCGKEVLEKNLFCPNCGCPIKRDIGSFDVGRFKEVVPESAKAACVLGILAILLPPLCLPAIVYADKSINETGGIMCKQAKAGFICGFIALCFGILTIKLIINIF